MATSDNNISAKIILDSMNPDYPSCRLTTFVLTLPRIILAELNTHRMFSRNTASSRAIPIKKTIQKVKDNPFIPSWIGRNQSGMQSNQELDRSGQDSFKQNWTLASLACTNIAERLEDIGVHKQITNRILEPWMYVTTIVTATDYANFFRLRCNKDAQPEFMALAFKMLEAYVESEPVARKMHIPFGDKFAPGLTEEDRIKVAVARCARISYENHDGSINPEDDIRLANQLAKNGHMSPFEHIARANNMGDYYTGNFRGWIQQRKLIQGENVQSINYKKLLDEKPEWV